MTRGATIKTDTEKGWQLERRMITRRYRFEWDRNKCVGCGTCAAVCPKEALDVWKGRSEQGKITYRPGVKVEESKCVYCGECVALCPVHALSMTVNGQPEIPVLTWEAFPQLIKGITVKQASADEATARACVEACPTRVITLLEQGNGASAITMQVDEPGCIYCKQCEALAPDNFEVTSPWEGRITLDSSLCTTGCRVCAEICPTDALTWDEAEGLQLHQEFCLYCGACERIAPVEGVVVVQRSAIRHQPIKSAAWTAALEKLISIEAAVRELQIKAQAKRRQAARFLPGANKTSS